MSSPDFAPLDGFDTDLRTLFELERIDRDLFRAATVFSERFALYGGQVAAQALRAAGSTTPEGRRPHSLHGYFLRPGNAAQPTVFQVFRDRDGGSFSARRVVALQDGEVIFSASVSFQGEVPEAPREQVPTLGEDVPSPDESPAYTIPRLFSFEGRSVPQPHEAPGAPSGRWPTRFWARCAEPELAADPLVDACVVTYLSDISTGIGPFARDGWWPGPSLDHAIWFHQNGGAADWMLMDLHPHAVANGRGLYTGSIFDAAGHLLATLAQECLHRAPRPS
ncbi:acyl-CoA thioesterase [Nocardioides insulae]|uniref:acyl-CoA thioesterase n=1 Tax=Nocardioides insulae TaxID=394734 RepID=UPI00042635F7|nr:acyl-CoA thioesterase domain-containing protein [Nocardioides insulae]